MHHLRLLLAGLCLLLPFGSTAADGTDPGSDRRFAKLTPADLDKPATRARIAAAALERIDPSSPAWEGSASSVAKLHAAAGDLTAARRVVDSMAPYGLRDLALSGIARTQAQAGDIDAIDTTLAAIRSGFTHDMALVGILYAATTEGRPLDLRALALRIKDEEDRARGLAIWAAALVEADKDAEALELLTLVKEPANKAVLLCQIADAQVAARRVDAARQTLDQARTYAAALTPGREQGKVLEELALASGRAGQFTLAEASIQAISDTSRRGVTLARLAAEYAAADRATDSEAAIARVPQSVLKPWIWVEITKGHLRAGNFTAAEAAIGRVTPPADQAPLRIRLALAQARDGSKDTAWATLRQVETALATLDPMHKRLPAAVMLAVAQHALGHTDAARVTFDRVLTDLDSMADPASGSWIIVQLIIETEKADHRDWTLALLGRISTPSDTIAACSMLSFLHDFRRHGRLHEVNP